MATIMKNKGWDCVLMSSKESVKAGSPWNEIPSRFQQFFLKGHSRKRLFEVSSKVAFKKMFLLLTIDIIHSCKTQGVCVFSSECSLCLIDPSEVEKKDFLLWLAETIPKPCVCLVNLPVANQVIVDSCWREWSPVCCPHILLICEREEISQIVNLLKLCKGLWR